MRSSSSSDVNLAKGASRFLEELQSRGIGIPKDIADQAESLVRKIPADAQSLILSALADGGAKDVADLILKSGLTLGDVLSKLDQLVKYGLITRDDSAGIERFALSEAGQRTAEQLGFLKR